MKLLLVDDHAAFRAELREVLAPLKATCCECADGSQAVAACSEHTPDWVLMDLAMPGQNGITTTRQLKARFPQLRIVILTEYDDPEIREAAAEAGACGYLLKDDLLAVVAFLQNAESRSPRSNSANS